MARSRLAIRARLAGDEQRDVYNLERRGLGYGLNSQVNTGTPEILEPHKCTELVWADPDDLPADTLDFIAQAWADAQNGRILREHGFTTVRA